MMISHFVWCLIFPTLFALIALKKKSVSFDGAVAGWIVAYLCATAGREFLLTLLFFFISSTIFTKMGAKHKMLIDSEYKVGGQRNCIQVFANGFSGTVACVAYLFVQDATLKLCFASAFVSHYACCCGDTWASECGTAFKNSVWTTPVLVTTFKRVPSGTNGGISIIGTCASAAGGCLIGMVFWATSESPSWSLSTMATFGIASGFGGSMLDSLFGACLQYSGLKDGCIINHPLPQAQRVCGRNVLDNHQVNFISSLVTAIGGFMAARRLASP